ncbi:phosphatidic acid phosphatase type 2 domain containing protein, putative [Entamoeba invadens IP1]|uniref:Phosphatidic acid phosphatase type 2 domain containing protein, putative n=1 Tax=Entamoeba invadens IP1 TaxID=370355 RepID=A0A0A1UB92_ENTIV|nr:phosphatidic acid phosphatase type 2 domain containing protein, putative [Entamoeba invadens IP1]ELP89471.1 phosphatidic acid phosphatase type 2 domain containing protein, putative [Entamoeba invadens IP1]|eukprot:XP_004256242.1 phosphatidic acid phosphatase type 2 domain containing protein, putative [Entamoeba invadens IP1]
MVGIKEFLKSQFAHKVVVIGFIEDFIINVVLIVLCIVPMFIHPFHMEIPDGSQNVNMMYPYVHSSVPTYACCLLAYLPPALLIIIFSVKKKSLLFLVFSALTLLLAALSCLSLTNWAKIFAGRPRPHFYARLEENSDQIDDVYKSFPSGHSSTIFNGMSFTACFVAGQIKIFGRSHASWKLLLFIMPWIIASVVAISRTRDYHHNFSDILGGTAFGIFFGVVVYLAKFKNFSAENCDDLKIEEDVDKEKNATITDEEKTLA